MDLLSSQRKTSYVDTIFSLVCAIFAKEPDLESYASVVGNIYHEILNPEKNTIIEYLADFFNGSATRYYAAKHPSYRSLLEFLVAFTDDHFLPVEQSFFHRKSVEGYIDGIMRSDNALTIPYQYRMAFDFSRAPLDAAILCHNAYRIAARNNDKRLGLSLSMEDRASIAWKTAAFSCSEGGDILGDNYHFWAQFTAGMASYINKSTKPVKTGVFDFLFRHDACLTKTLRKKKMIFGYHEKVGRLGFEVGGEIAGFAYGEH